MSKDEQSDDDKIRKSVTKEQVKASKDINFSLRQHGKGSQMNAQ